LRKIEKQRRKNKRENAIYERRTTMTTKSTEMRKKNHDKAAPYWAAALVLFMGLGLSPVWFDAGNFGRGYLLDMFGPAWNYILFRGLFTSYAENAWTHFFTPKSTLFIFLSVCVLIESAQYFKLYDATFDPWDFLAYVSILLPVFLIDFYAQRKNN